MKMRMIDRYDSNLVWINESHVLTSIAVNVIGDQTSYPEITFTSLNRDNLDDLTEEQKEDEVRYVRKIRGSQNYSALKSCWVWTSQLSQIASVIAWIQELGSSTRTKVVQGPPCFSRCSTYITVSRNRATMIESAILFQHFASASGPRTGGKCRKHTVRHVLTSRE